jgi:hypothetical protein
VKSDAHVSDIGDLNEVGCSEGVFEYNMLGVDSVGNVQHLLRMLRILSNK